MGDDYQLSFRGFLLPAQFSSEKLADYYENLFAAQSVNPAGWQVKSEGVKLAKGLLGTSLLRWVGAQVNGNYLYGRRYEFLLDTLSFIQTGKRKMSVDNWYELLEEFPGPDNARVGAQKAQTLQKFESILTDYDFIAQWCSHKNGFEDMVCTLFTIAGPHRSTDVPPMRGAERLTVKHL